MAGWSKWLLLVMGLLCCAECLAQEAMVEIDVPSISERDFMRIQKRAAIMQAASEKNKVDPLLQEATKAQVDAALEHLVPGRDHHYFATAKEREEFEQKWEEWSAGDEDARGPEPVPVLQTFRYYASAEEEDEQEEAARLLRVIIDKGEFPALSYWVEEQWVSGALLLGVERPLRMEAASLDDVTTSLFDVVICTNGVGEAVSRLFQQSKDYGQDVSSQNVGVFDFSSSCVEKAWMKDASYFFTTAYCPELQRLYPEKSFWTPRGYQIFTPWRPETLPPASERGYLYVVEVGFKGNKAAKKFSDAQLPNEFSSYELKKPQELMEDPIERFIYLREAAFVPCVPSQLHCVFDALQSGAIPITADAYKSANPGLGRVPYLRVNSWDNVPAIMRYFAKRPQELNDLQTRVIAWWDDYQASLAFRVNQVMDIHFGDFQLAYFE